MFKKIIFISIFTASLLGFSIVSADSQSVNVDSAKTIAANLSDLQSLPTSIDSVKTPDIKNPAWLQTELDAEAAAAELARQQALAAAELARQQTYIATPRSNGTVTYDVSTRGSIIANLTEFESLANQTLNSSNGWARLGVGFQQVASGGSFSLVLSEASQVPSFYPSICSIYWSCQVGRYVIINQDRWLYASDSWNQAGGSLRDYRNMVINHETGHWLGHRDDNGHCGGGGQLAPVMQQQSINLLGCNFNPWPLGSELWSSRLGV